MCYSRLDTLNIKFIILSYLKVQFSSTNYIHIFVQLSLLSISRYLGFFYSLVGKESACNAGDPGLIPGSGRSPGEGMGYPLQYSWASLVAQLVKNPPVMQETPVRLLGWEDPLEKGWATHSSIHGLPWWLRQ